MHQVMSNMLQMSPHEEGLCLQGYARVSPALEQSFLNTLQIMRLAELGAGDQVAATQGHSGQNSHQQRYAYPLEFS